MGDRGALAVGSSRDFLAASGRPRGFSGAQRPTLARLGARQGAPWRTDGDGKARKGAPWRAQERTFGRDSFPVWPLTEIQETRRGGFEYHGVSLQKLWGLYIYIYIYIYIYKPGSFWRKPRGIQNQFVPNQFPLFCFGTLQFLKKVQMF